MAARALDLDVRCVARHHDDCGDAEAARMIGDTLRMISRGRCDTAVLPLLQSQGEQFVKCTALLEGGRELQVLEFEIDLGPGDVRQRPRIKAWRIDDRTAQCARRFFNSAQVGKHYRGRNRRLRMKLSPSLRNSGLNSAGRPRSEKPTSITRSFLSGWTHAMPACS